MKIGLAAVVVCLLMVLVMGSAQAAPYLACDLPAAGVTISKSEIEITKVKDGSTTTVSGLVNPRPGDFLLLDLAGMAAESYRFRGRWADGTGWWSEWSPFLDAGKPAAMGGFRVAQ